MGDIEKVDNAMTEDAQRDIKKAALDTTHTDEAMTILANYDGDETWTEKEEKHLVKRIDRKLLSLLVCMYYSGPQMLKTKSMENRYLWASILRQSYAVSSCEYPSLT
jgi:hypothetical protein